MTNETSTPAQIRSKLDDIVDGVCSGACGCMGPQGDEPVCPCDMRNVIRWRGRWIRLTAIGAGLPANYLDDLTPGNSRDQKLDFDVILVSHGESKVTVIKEVRVITGMGLAEAKYLVDTLPKAVAEGVSRAEATVLKHKLVAVGATVEFR